MKGSVTEETPHTYEFGDFRLDAARRRLLGRVDNQRVKLTSKAFDTLLFLVRHGGVVLDKDELMRAVWPDTVVEENNLSQKISELRRVLGESHGENRYIVTVPGRGFSFVADVRAIAGEQPPPGGAEAGMPTPAAAQGEVTPASPQPGRHAGGLRGRVWPAVIIGVFLAALGAGALYLWRVRTSTGAGGPVRSIAVLPFKSLVTEGRDEALELGMADTLIAKLSASRELVVRPIGSVRRYGGVEQDALAAGRELGVEAALDGTIQRSGDRVRVTARLLRVSDGRQLWAGQFDGTFGDIFAVQDSISERVMRGLALELTDQERQRLAKNYTENTEAYRLYLLGLFHWNKRTVSAFEKSIEYFQQAIAADPNYALAYAGLADAYALLAEYDGAPPRDAHPKAREAALKALSLDGQLADAHAALGLVLCDDYDFAGAEREYKRALDLNPRDATARQLYGNLLTYLGRHEEALAEVRRALEVEPLSLIINRSYGDYLLYARRYDEGIAQLEKTVNLDANFGSAHISLANAHWMKGEYAATVEEYSRYQEVSGRREQAALMREGFSKGGWEGFVRTRLEDLRTSNTPYEVALYRAALGEKDKAFAELEKSYEDREWGTVLLKVDPRLDSLRSDPRYEELLRRVGLTQ